MGYTKCRVFVLLFVLLLWGCPGRSQPIDEVPVEGVIASDKGWALLVGVDRYGESPCAPPEKQRWRALRGAESDVRMLSGELRRRGFKVKTLINEEATLENIVAQFEAHLIANASEGDVAVFHFSGHGQPVKDEEGGDEADGWDESLVPYDNCGKEDSSKNLIDDRLHGLLKALRARTRQAVVILDSCYSGTATRGHSCRGDGPPSGHGAQTVDSFAGGLSDEVEQGEGELGYVVLTASSPLEKACEVPVAADGQGDRVFSGAFSHALLTALKDPRSTGGMTYRSLLREVQARMPALGTLQTPQAEGDLDREVFAGRLGGRRASGYLASVDAVGRILVEAGEVHGIEEGTEFAIFAPGRLRDEAPLVRVKVERVKFDAAVCAPVEGSEPFDVSALSKGGHAVEVVSVNGPSSLVLNAGDLAGDLHEALDALSFVKLEAQPEVWDLRLTPSAAQGDCFQLISAGGALVPIPRGADQMTDACVVTTEPDWRTRVRWALDGWARRKRLERLQMRRDPLPVRLILERYRPDEGYEVLSNHHTTGQAQAEDVLAFRVVNDSAEPVYVNLVQFSSDGCSVQVWSALDVEEDVRGRPVLVERPTVVAGNQERRLSLKFKVKSGMTGSTVFKLIATARPVDFRGMAVANLCASDRVKQSLGVRSRGGDDLSAELNQLFAYDQPAAIRGRGEKKWGTDTVYLDILP